MLRINITTARARDEGARKKAMISKASDEAAQLIHLMSNSMKIGMFETFEVRMMKSVR